MHKFVCCSTYPTQMLNLPRWGRLSSLVNFRQYFLKKVWKSFFFLKQFLADKIIFLILKKLCKFDAPFKRSVRFTKNCSTSPALPYNYNRLGESINHADLVSIAGSKGNVLFVNEFKKLVARRVKAGKKKKNFRKILYFEKFNF